MTSVIIETMYKGVKLQAFGSKGAKYSCSVIEVGGKHYLSSFNTIRTATEYFINNEISKMVLYIYHPKTNKFEVVKYFER